MPRLQSPESAIAIADNHDGLISAQQCESVGINAGRRATLVRHGVWERVVLGVYDTLPQAPMDMDRRRRCAAWTGLLAMGKQAVSVGQCALALRGVAGLPQVLTPEVAMMGGRSVPGPQGVLVRRYRQVPVPVLFAGWQVSDLPTALVHALPSLSRRHAVAVLDSVLNCGWLDDDALGAVRRQLVGKRGSRRLAEVWPLVNPLAESPLETWARLDCVDGGVPPDDVQIVIRDQHGAFVARCDMAWRRADGRYVIAEIDGREVHSSPTALYADRKRQNRLLTMPGITVLRFTSQDLREPGTIARAVRQALHTR